MPKTVSCMITPFPNEGEEDEEGIINEVGDHCQITRKYIGAA